MTQGSGQWGGPKTVKDIQFNNSGLINGIDQLAEAVGSTLGAAGRTVVIEDDFGNAHVTKDGVTVAESILLRDPVENLGVTMMKQAAKQTASKAGDGTTTSTVLAHAIIHESIGPLESETFRSLNEGIQTAKDAILEKLDQLSKPISDKDLSYVAKISANNDEVLGNTIAQAFIEAGESGVVTVEQGDSSDTVVDTKEGTIINSSSITPHFYTDMEKEEAVLDNPVILFSASKIPNMTRIQGLLEEVIRAKRSILIVSEVDEQVMTSLAMNKVKGNIQCNIISPPSFGQKKADLLEDLTLLFGGKVINEELGDSLDSITFDMLGTCQKTISNSDGTVFVQEGISDSAKDKVSSLKEKLEAEDHPILKKHIERRLALLTGGVSIIKVGGDSEIEVKERLDRVDDAVHAVKAARKEGIVAGGGATLMHIAESFEPKNTGENILIESIKSPFNKILENAGLNPKSYCLTNPNQGVNVITGKIEDMFKSGIVDPVLVTKQALSNAVSVATTILSTDAVISNVRIDG